MTTVKPDGWRRVPALERFRPYLTLKASPRTPLLVGGIIHAYDMMERPEAPLAWFERNIPERYRLDLASQRGLQPFAVDGADKVSTSSRSEEWRRLLRWKTGYRALDARGKLALLRLLSSLSFYQDTERLTADAEPKLERPLDEVAANHAYIRLADRFMLHERELITKTAPFRRIAEQSPKGSRIRVIAAVKYMTLNLEHALVDDSVREMEGFARAAVDELGDGVSPAEKHALESKYWRTVSYFPHLNEDFGEMAKRLEMAEETARRALQAAKTGSDFDRGYAAENIYAVIATKAIAATHLDRPDEARGHYDRLIDLDPLGAWQRFGLARTLARQGEHALALDQLKAAFHLAPPLLPEGWTLMANCLKSLGCEAEAKTWEKRAAARTPALPVPPAAGRGDAR